MRPSENLPSASRQSSSENVSENISLLMSPWESAAVSGVRRTTITQDDVPAGEEISARTFTLVVQAAGLLFPGIRRLLGAVPLGALDITATLAGGVLPYLLNEAARSGQAPGAAPRGLQITARSNAAAERSST
jgi:hypothetical protein